MPNDYICIYRGWIQVTPDIILSNVTISNNLLMNLYFENSTIKLHVLYVLNVHTKFHTNRMLFTIRSINSSFICYFKLQKLEFIQLIDRMTIDLYSP